MAEQKTLQHLAVICDGNRRWAKAHNLPPYEGHRYAVQEVFEPLIDQAMAKGIKYLTFWIFSTENWQRDKLEVEMLMNLFRHFFDHQLSRLHEKDIRVQVIGNKKMFSKDIQERIAKGEKLTKDNKGIVVTLAMSYGGHDELVRAVQKIVAQNVAAQDVTEELIEQNLDTAMMPSPDFIVRTSGEQRLSGFMSWQSEYSEFYFPQWHFPEFSPDKLDEVIEEFQKRQRRFGK